MDVHALRKTLLGRNRPALVAGLAAGLLLGLDAWWVYPHLDGIYNLVPDNPVDWQFVAVFVGLPALVAVRDGGLLTAWWVDAPALVAVYLRGFTVVGAAGGENAIRAFTAATVLPAIGVGLAVALLWGTLGYLLGRGARTGIRRVYHPQSGS